MAKYYGIKTLGSLSTLTTHREGGYIFKALSDIKVTGFRIYVPNVVSNVNCRLWDSRQSCIATATVTQSVVDDWAEVYLENPINLSSGEEYAVSCFIASNRYSSNISACTASEHISVLQGIYGTSEGSYPMQVNATDLYQIIDIIYEYGVEESYYRIRKSTLVSFGDKARKISGQTGDLTTAQMINIFEGASSGDGGVEDGYDVSFFDENGEELALYSVKVGHEISKPPKYACSVWKTSDGATVTFPYVPTSDVSLYANSDTYADQLYKFYGVDKGVYPFVTVFLQNGYTELNFTKEKPTLRTNGFTCMPPRLMGSKNTSLTSYVDDMETFISKLMTTVTSVSTVTSGGGWTMNSSYYLFTNYDTEGYITEYAGIYRLDDVTEPLPYDGLSNGYDVMFYDENNEGLAFYSVKQGHGINPPVYNCKNWQDANGGVIVFPYTPSGDAIFYANNSTYADQLYKFYGVDKGIYPYLIIEHGGTNTNGNGFVLVRIWFASTITIGTSAITFSATNLVGGGQTHKPSQWSDDLAEFVSQVMERITTLATASSQSLSAKVQFREAYEGPSKYSAKAYLNFDCSLTVRTLYRLDE